MTDGLYAFYLFDIKVCLRVHRKRISKVIISLHEFTCPKKGLIPSCFKEYTEGKADVKVRWEALNTDGIPDKALKVYKFLKEKIPPGETISYGELASLTGTHPRFVGYCMKVNRFPLIIPCHRVVGKRSLGGYSQGITVKERLLELEKDLFGG